MSRDPTSHDQPWGVIFDMDGVLIDSYQPHLESWQRMFRNHGLEMTEEQFRATFGRTNREIFRELTPTDFRTLISTPRREE